MSYILEALKKSQHEREPGTPPGAMSAPPADSAGVGRRWRLITAGLLLAVLALAALLIFGPGAIDWRTFSRAEPRQTTGGAPPAAVAAPDPGGADKSEARAAPPPAAPGATAAVPAIGTAPAPAGAHSGSRENDAAPAGPVAEISGRGEPAAAAAPAPAADPAITAEEQERRRMRAELLAIKQRIEAAKGDPPEAAAAATRKSAAAPLPPAAIDAAGEAAAPAGPEPPGSPQDLPTALRERLPPRKISVLAYSNSPERRFITLNGDRMREGERDATGLTVEEIRPDGVIFSFEGQRFFQSAFSP